MEKRSLYDVFRKRIAPVLMGVLLAIISVRTCASEMAAVEIRPELGAHRNAIESLRIDVFPEGQDQGVASFERNYRAAGGEPLGFVTKLDTGMYRLQLTVRARGRIHSFERRIDVADASDRTVITVNIERELDAMR